MSEYQAQLRTAIGTIEFIGRNTPRMDELVDGWANYLEFWARTGGIDEAGYEELEEAHHAMQKRTKEILIEAGMANPYEPLVQACSNTALAAAQELRDRTFNADSGGING